MEKLQPLNIKFFELIFPSNKRKLSSDNVYATRCPICGDSKKNPNKMRFFLYTKPQWDDDFVMCHNCGYSHSFFYFIREECPEYFNAYKAEKHTSSFNEILNIEKKENKVEMVERIERIDRNDLKIINTPDEFHSIWEVKDALKYLLKRKIKPKEWYYCSSEKVLNIDGKNVRLNDYIIVPLLTSSNEMYGFYSRCIKYKQFHTFIPSENYGYKIWNYFHVDKTNVVYIFEGIFDAMSSGLGNVIAMLGADLNQDRLDEIPKRVFCFDNDLTGAEKSIKYAQMGEKVIIYPDYVKCKDLNKMLEEDWTKDEIKEMILSNTYSGTEAVVKLNMKLNNY